MIFDNNFIEMHDEKSKFNLKIIRLNGTADIWLKVFRLLGLKFDLFFKLNDFQIQS